LGPVGALIAVARPRVWSARIVTREPFVPLPIERQVGETQLFVKEVKIEGKRYIVCHNESEADLQVFKSGLT
jgi:hypothetical protein